MALLIVGESATLGLFEFGYEAVRSYDDALNLAERLAAASGGGTAPPRRVIDWDALDREATRCQPRPRRSPRRAPCRPSSAGATPS